jgi:hypothetical protein
MPAQLTLDDYIPPFRGKTYEASEDKVRLSGQLERVRALMADSRWRTLREIAVAVGGSEAGVSARLRDLRRIRFGGLRVERMRVTSGLYTYRVTDWRESHD